MQNAEFFKFLKFGCKYGFSIALKPNFMVRKRFEEEERWKCSVSHCEDAFPYFQVATASILQQLSRLWNGLQVKISSLEFRTPERKVNSLRLLLSLFETVFWNRFTFAYCEGWLIYTACSSYNLKSFSNWPLKLSLFWRSRRNNPLLSTSPLRAVGLLAVAHTCTGDV